MEKRRRRSAAAMLAFVVFAAMAAGQSAGQSQPAPAAVAGSAAASAISTKQLAWDVVSVKRADPNQCVEGSGLQFTPDGVHIFCVPLLVVMEAGYEIIDPSRIIAPQWVKTGGFWNIDGKVAAEDLAAFKSLPPKDKDRMLQPLLADRFHLKAHIEQREMPVYDLVVAKGGAKLKEATPDDVGKAFMGMRQQGKMEAVGMQLKNFLPALLTRETGRPVVDKTGLTGKYDFTLEYVPASKAATDETGGPSIFTALEEQLGLKLEPARVPMDVLVIDSIEQPAAN